MRIIKYLAPVLIMAFGIVACTESTSDEPAQAPFQPELLTGEWTIRAVHKSNGDKINSVSDGSIILDDKTITINLAGFPGIENGVPMTYDLNDKTISNVGEFELDFEVTNLTDKNLIMKSDIRGVKLEFELEK